MRQQPYENISAEWEEAPRGRDAWPIWERFAPLQAALQRQISLSTFLLLMTTIIITVVLLEMLFAAGVLVGLLLAPHMMMHAMQAAPGQPGPMQP